MAALTLTNFYSARAILDSSQTPPYSPSLHNGVFEDNAPYPIPIYSSPGIQIQKLHIPLAAIVIISVLLFLQITGLLALGVYSSMRHTWTASVDVFALLRMGNAIGDSLPLISAANKKEAGVLDVTGGWIGDGGGLEGEEVGVRLLQVGGSSRVLSKANYRTKRDPAIG